jgi:hypothetical protein
MGVRRAERRTMSVGDLVRREEMPLETPMARPGRGYKEMSRLWD